MISTGIASKLQLHFISTLEQNMSTSVKAALIDLSGTLHVDTDPTPNAVDSLKRLRKTNIAIKFVTNTTKESKKTLYQRLCNIGFDLSEDEIYSSLSAAADYVQRENLNPFYLLTKDARTDFPPEDPKRPLNAVVVGLAPEEFHYVNLNKAFNLLISNKDNRFVAIHQGKYYKRDGELALGPGCFVKGLEYAAGSQAVLIGKPNSYFFKSAIPEGVSPTECVMIGDDAADDIMGAMKIGMKGIQVKTGKYLPAVVADPPPTALVENFTKAVEWIIETGSK